MSRRQCLKKRQIEWWSWEIREKLKWKDEMGMGMEGKGKGGNVEKGNNDHIKNHMETYYCRSFLKYCKNLNRVAKYKDRQCPNYTFLNHKIRPPVSGRNYNLLKHWPMEPLYIPGYCQSHWLLSKTWWEDSTVQGNTSLSSNTDIKLMPN